MHAKTLEAFRQPFAPGDRDVELRAQSSHIAPVGVEQLVDPGPLHDAPQKRVGITGDKILVKDQGFDGVARRIGGDPPAAPGRGSFDDIRGLRRDCAPGLPGAEEHAIVGVEGHRRAGDPDDLAACAALFPALGARSNNHDLVPKPGRGGEFLAHIAGDAPAGLGIEPGDIDDLHVVALVPARDR